MKWGWIAGWGVDPAALGNLVQSEFPETDHEVVLPGPVVTDWVESLDRVIGWSWGAFRLLQWCREQKANLQPGKVYLLAPFAGFCSEDGLGGRCSRTQVKFLRRWLKRSPAEALSDFYSRSGLDFEIPTSQSPHLAFWEDQLAQMGQATLLANPKGGYGLPDQIRGWIGQDDTLLDAEVVGRLLGIEVVPGATHHIRDFFPLLRKALLDQKPTGV